MIVIFNFAKLTNINVSLKNGQISLTAKIPLDDANFDNAESLRPYLDAETGGVTLEIRPTQPPLPIKPK